MGVLFAQQKYIEGYFMCTLYTYISNKCAYKTKCFEKCWMLWVECKWDSLHSHSELCLESNREKQTLNKLKSSSKLCQTPLPLSEEEKELFFCMGSRGTHLQHDPRFTRMWTQHWKHTRVNTRKPTSCHNMQDLTFSLGAETIQSSHECVYMAACAVSEGGEHSCSCTEYALLIISMDVKLTLLSKYVALLLIALCEGTFEKKTFSFSFIKDK